MLPITAVNEMRLLGPGLSLRNDIGAWLSFAPIDSGQANAQQSCSAAW
jgi:hypothetical protein